MNETSNKGVIWTVVAIVGIIILAVVVYKSPSVEVMDQNMATSTDEAMTNGGTGSTGTKASGSTGSAKSSTSQLDTIAGNISTLSGMISNSSLRVPETPVDVTLKGGTASYTNGQVKGTVTVGKVLGMTKVEAGYDVFVEMTITSNTVPGQKRVAVYNLTTAGTKYMSSVVIGDRVILKSLTITDDANVAPEYRYENLNMRFANIPYKVAVNYLAHGNGVSASSTPTVPRDIQFSVKNHIISK
jgi:hypothetical protein